PIFQALEGFGPCLLLEPIEPPWPTRRHSQAFSPPPCGGAKSTRCSGVGLVLLGCCAVRVLGLFS
ncbi:unnamed protein product, partial [Ectocarpus sp. 4 AP-2014]